MVVIELLPLLMLTLFHCLDAVVAAVQRRGHHMLTIAVTDALPSLFSVSNPSQPLAWRARGTLRGILARERLSLRGRDGREDQISSPPRGRNQPITGAVWLYKVVK